MVIKKKLIFLFLSKHISPLIKKLSTIIRSVFDVFNGRKKTCILRHVSITQDKP